MKKVDWSKVIIYSTALPIFICLTTKGAHPFGGLALILLWVVPPLITFPICVLQYDQEKLVTQWIIFIALWIMYCIGTDVFVMYASEIEHALKIKSEENSFSLIVLILSEMLGLFITIILNKKIMNFLNRTSQKRSSGRFHF